MTERRPRVPLPRVLLPRVLLVEDDPSLSRVYAAYLAAEALDLDTVDTGAAALAALGDAPPDALVLDLKLPDMDGLDILRRVAAQGLPCPVVVITAHGSVNVAVEAMQAGAADFLLKPFKKERLVYTLRNALERQRLADTVDTLRADLDREAFGGFIGSSLAMQRVYRIIDSAAPSRATVFITGESGTGKEVCAQAIHDHSGRAGRFVALNCGAIPRDLMESEIFGHVKGAFTGATTDRDGAAALADGGTLFLDEICELPLDLQVKLLRFVQTNSYQKVGTSDPRPVDVRFVCATNKDPWAEVQAGRFREDLYYRLHVIPLPLPPLREREGDVLAIAERFLADMAAEEGKAFDGFDTAAAARLAAFDWPGNVRQLQNVVRSLVVLNPAGGPVGADMLPPPLSGLEAPTGGANGARNGTASPVPAPAPEAGGIRPLWRVEREMIRAALDACDGNVPRAAALLELSPSTVYRRLRALDDRAARP
ncbi:MAG: sigma-54-dependent Fis family transcriptional regulator [Rhodobacterales bacterium]|nr:sigma-54-dependent Fis family transcriptional regulator [Rhodobacterales bacterium]